MDIQELMVTMNREKEKLRHKVREQATTIHQLTDTMGGGGGPLDSPQVRHSSSSGGSSSNMTLLSLPCD